MDPSTAATDGTRTGSSPSLAKRTGKILAVRVQMLDETITLFQIQAKALGSVLFEQVCQQVNLLEADYFGLEYAGTDKVKYWLDLEKPMNRQLELSTSDPLLRFAVKFYPSDPAQLEEEFTRYLFCMQIKQDLAHGVLQCNDNTAALIASYLVQAECGDYVAEDYPDHTYLSSYKFIPQQDAELERRIMENHKKHVGQSPAEADLNLLETSRRCELYGIKMHPAKDPEGVPLNLAVAHMGVMVFQNFAKINTFSWAKVRKLSFKRKKFLIKLHPEAHGNYKDVVEFHFEGRDECKNFWKKCVEHHGFFRCTSAKNEPRPKPGVLSRGSSFRYTGRTQKEIVEFVRENYVKRQSFQRSQSFRHASPQNTSASGVGNSLSVHPLLPVGDNVIVASDSVSCGSMAIAPSDARARSISTTERAEKVDVHHYSEEPQSPYQHRETDSRLDVESPSTSNNSAASPSSSHRPVYHQYQQQQSPASPGVFHSLPRSGAQPSSSLPADDEEPTASPSRQVERPQVKEKVEAFQLNHTINGVADKACSPPLSPLLGQPIENNNNINNNMDGSRTTKSSNGLAEGELRRKRHPTEKAYYIAKELLMTERTYKKDLEVIDLWFRDELSKEEYMPEEVLTLLFNHIDPLYEHHTLLLKDIEHRMAAWEGRANAFTKGDVHRVGDLLLKMTGKIELYNRYIEKHRLILEKLEQSFKRNKTFEQIYRDFETRKVCYLPLNTFLLRPLQRILHYQLIVERLLKNYEPTHADYNDCTQARIQMEQIITNITHNIHATENFVKLVELQRDLVGIDNVVCLNREFIREGCLQKLSRKGFQQRMFFLFSDVLLYTNRTSGSQLQFKVHGQLPLRGVMVEESEPKMGNQFCFTIYGGNRALLVAANSQEEKDKWLEDILQAVQSARELPEDASRLNYFSLKSCSSSEEVLDKTGAIEDSRSNGADGKERTQQQRSNTTVHVCWHRNTSISTRDHLLALENQLSGYLLRKFKNSNGWQKLWVVFTNFCLFFYKTFQDDFPLASLPLLGYSVTTPNERDHIHKEFVFKLQFKNHVYFFRAESEYTFNRWMEVISSATQHSGRLRLFSRKESETVSPRC